MKTEIDMIEKNCIWDLVNRPSNKPIIGVKRVYKTKLNLDGTVQKKKARLVAKGYSHKPRVYFNEFATIARRHYLDLDCLNNSEMLEPLSGGWETFILKWSTKKGSVCGSTFVIKKKEDKVYKLNKALYGLKQAPNVQSFTFADRFEFL